MRQLIFTPCDKVIQDPTTGPSLIATFQNLGVAVPADSELPDDAVIPKEWTIFSMWELSPEERGKVFTLNIEIFWPDGQLFLKQNTEVAAALPDWMNLIAKLPAFPIGQSGKVRVSVSVECAGVIVSGPTDTFITINVTRDDKIFAPQGKALGAMAT